MKLKEKFLFTHETNVLKTPDQMQVTVLLHKVATDKFQTKAEHLHSDRI